MNPANDARISEAYGKTADVDVDVQHEPEAINPPRFAFLKSKKFWLILALGQMLSWCIVGTNTLVTYMAQSGNNTPAFENLMNYALLFLIYTPYTIYKYGFKKWARMIYTRGWKFIIWAFIDVEGNYFVVKAYNYTSLLSCELLDAWAVVVVVILSFTFLKVRYHWTQCLGIVVCLCGLGLLVGSDALTHKDWTPSDRVKGDLFMLLGASCYGVSNTFEEWVVSKQPLYEVLGQLGMWATIINGIQIAIFERHSLATAHWDGNIGGYLAGYTLIMFTLYSTAPLLFRMSSATFYNLSILTSDFWGLLIGVKLFHYYVYWLYPIAFVCVVLGLTIYYVVVRGVEGEARKPWLGGEAQEAGVAGVGTYKKKTLASDVAV